MEKELSKLTDQELLEQAKKIKSNAVFSALVIGIMVGVIIYSVVNKSIGIFTLVPLFFIYKIMNDPKAKKNKEALEKLLKERNLK